MAQVIPSPIVSDLRGSVAGSTFRHQGAKILALRRTRAPSRVARPGLSLHNALSQASFSWNNLSTAQRAAWQAAFSRVFALDSAQGQPRSFSAWDYFCEINLPRIRHAIALITTPPGSPFRCQAWKNPWATPSSAGIVFYFNVEPLLAGEHCVATISRAFSRAVVNPRAWCRAYTVWTGPINTMQYWPVGFVIELAPKYWFTARRLSTSQRPSILNTRWNWRTV